MYGQPGTSPLFLGVPLSSLGTFNVGVEPRGMVLDCDYLVSFWSVDFHQGSRRVKLLYAHTRSSMWSEDPRTSRSFRSFLKASTSS